MQPSPGTIGPLLPVHRVGLANIRAAFPEQDTAWHQATLKQEWDNLGRVAGEYVHLDKLWDFDPWHPHRGRIQSDDAALFIDLLTDANRLCVSRRIWGTGARGAGTAGLWHGIPPWSTACRTIRSWRARSSGSGQRRWAS